MNALGKIFDAQEVQERQEFFGLFSKTIFNAIGDLGLKEGSPEKIALDAAAGAFIAKLGGADAMSGLTGAAIAQLAENFLKDIKDPLVHQLMSYVISGTATKLISGSFQTGAAIGTNEAKYNYLTHEQQKQYKDKITAIEDSDMSEAEKEKAKKEVDEYYINLSREQTAKGESGEEEGLGYEYGYDPEMGGAINILPNDINAQNKLLQNISALNIGKTIDTSSWKSNELKTITIGGNVGFGEFLGASGSTGFAMDDHYNMYRVTIVGVSAGIDASKFTTASLLKVLSKVTAGYNSQTINGNYTTEELKDKYAGSSTGGSVTHMLINIGLSKAGDELVANYGASSGLASVDYLQTKLEYIGNARTGKYE
ncbi:hypothetical protein [uncultured Phascolarctobacterium sp.]|uniref:hypothetical protein n=1 Tax=uncultured Phascolarctobacterium sp. TaxID=512296 RepID=UPI0025EFFCF3|nr:hypothetical protein [uncultured Phascolarctobacterium sp.]